MPRAIALLLSAALAALAGGPVVPACAQGVAVLSASVHSAEIALPPRPDGALLEVTVVTVRNPRAEPVSLRVTLRDAERRGEPIDVMRFALFPSDQPGAAVGRPDAALRRLQQARGAMPTRVIAQITIDSSAGAASATSMVTLSLAARWIPPPGAATPR